MLSTEASASPTRKVLREEAYARILSGILKGEFLPRERLVPSRLASQLKMSRTPVREALQQLEIQGYVTKDVSGGTLVKNPSEQEVQELYELREVLECGAIELVCDRITDAQLAEADTYQDKMEKAAIEGDFDRVLELNTIFHMDLLYGTMRNERLRSLLKSLRDRFLEQKLIRASMMEDWETKMQHHGKLLEALRHRDKSLAREVVRSHLSSTLEVQRRWLR